MIERGAKPLSLIAPNTTVYEANEIGEGAILCAYSTVTSNARIGRFFHSNIYSYVAHDCEIGDFVTFAPRVQCNGRVHIGDRAYIGTGAVIREGEPGKPLVIGEGAVIGMGAVVTKNVPPHTTVVGNPARVFKPAP
jgi:sugar O-acyltransferase (sialic acid O-acetyltransferase NeuD family)